MKTLGIMALTLFSLSAWSGDKAGNGGGGEVEFQAIKAELVTWMGARLSEGTLDQKLGLASVGIKGSDLYAKFTQAVSDVGNQVKFQDDPIVLDGYSTAQAGRICGNDPSPAHIVCNNSNWDQASAQIRYAIVLHEFLGVAGIETNQGEYSQYPISKNILHFVKRSDKYELGADAVASCPDLKLNGNWIDQFQHPFVISQVGCKLSFIDVSNGTLLYEVPLDGSTGAMPEAFYAARDGRGENFVSGISYSASILENGEATIALSGLTTIFGGTFDVSVQAAVHLIETPNPTLWEMDSNELLHMDPNSIYSTSSPSYQSMSAVDQDNLLDSNCSRLGGFFDGGLCKKYAIMTGAPYHLSAPATIQSIKLTFSSLGVSAHGSDAMLQLSNSGGLNSRLQTLNFAMSLVGKGETSIWLMKQP